MRQSRVSSRTSPARCFGPAKSTVPVGTAARLGRRKPEACSRRRQVELAWNLSSSAKGSPWRTPNARIGSSSERTATRQMNCCVRCTATRSPPVCCARTSPSELAVVAANPVPRHQGFRSTQRWRRGVYRAGADVTALAHDQLPTAESARSSCAPDLVLVAGATAKGYSGVHGTRWGARR